MEGHIALDFSSCDSPKTPKAISGEWGDLVVKPLLSHYCTVAHWQQRMTHPPSAHMTSNPLNACVCNSSTYGSSSQKIKAFNEDICTLIDGEEFVEEDDTRMFNKVRNEFCKWSIMVHSSFDEGECKVTLPTWRAGVKRGSGEAGDAVGKGSGHEQLVTGEPRLLCSTSRNLSQRASISKDLDRGFEENQWVLVVCVSRSLRCKY